MAEILGVGLTHYPPLLLVDEYMAFPLNMTLKKNEKVPAEMKNPTNWPEEMRVEYARTTGSPRRRATGSGWSAVFAPSGTR